MTQIPDAAVQAFMAEFHQRTGVSYEANIRASLEKTLPHLKPVDVEAVRRQAFEEGFENGVEQSLDALNAYDDITRNEAEQGIRKLKPDYRALSAAPTSEAE